MIRILNAFGVDIKRYPSIDLRRRKKLLDTFGITDIIDVGANFGQYAQEMRKIGFKGKIYSYEPLSEAFAKLSKHAKNESNWEINNFALGEKEEQLQINVAENFFSSSFLTKKMALEEQAPQTKYVKKELVQIKPLDTVFPDIYSQEKKIFLKIDTQGFEKQVLNGAKDSLSKIIGVQLEMALNPMYETAPQFMEMYVFLTANGFELFSLENGFYNPKTGQLNEVEGIFFRTDAKN